MKKNFETMESGSCNKNIELAIIEPNNYKHIFIMLHGYNGSIQEVVKLFPLEEYAEQYHLLIVIPELGNEYYLDKKHIPGKLDFVVSDFLCQELPNYIKQKYPIQKECKMILGGYSMGGFGTMLHGLNHPSAFHALISVNGAFIANEIAYGSSFVVGSEQQKQIARSIFMLHENELPIEVLSDDINRNPEAVVEQMDLEQIKHLPQIVLTCGTKDIWYSSTRRMKEKLSKKGISFSYMEIENGEHDFTAFDEGFRFGFERLLI